MKHKILSLLIILSLPAHAEEVVMKTPSGELHGTLEVVKKGGEHVVLILPGSGPTDRNGNSSLLSGRNNSLKYIAEYLLKNDVSSLRVDKRGIAASAKAMVDEKDLRIETYVDDAVRWIQFLKKRGYLKVTVLGHSEGSLIGLLASLKADTKVNGYISVAGPSRPAADVLTEQLAKQLPPAMLGKAKLTMAELQAGKTTDKFPAELAMLFRPSVQPYLISWFKCEPAKEIAKLSMKKVPILIVQGTTDIQVPLQAAKSLHTSALGSKLELIQGMNHVLKEATMKKESQDATYTDSTIPLHPELGEIIVQFVRK